MSTRGVGAELLPLLFLYIACVSDAGHEALQSVKRQFANHKLLQAKKVTAGLHSLHSVMASYYNSNISWSVDNTFSYVFFFKLPIFFINLALSTVLI